MKKTAADKLVATDWRVEFARCPACDSVEVYGLDTITTRYRAMMVRGRVQPYSDYNDALEDAVREAYDEDADYIDSESYECIACGHEWEGVE